MAQRFTFDLESCRDLLTKLERELERLKNTDRRQDIIDHAFNFAVTAWQMTEWVWADMDKHYQLKVEIAKELDISAGGLNQDDFKRYVRRRSPPIDYCRTIATASKHLGVDYPADIESVVSAQPQGAASISTNFEVSLDARATLKIVVDGNRRLAVDVFELALAYWTSFIYEHEIG